MDLCPRDLKSLALDLTRPLLFFAFSVNTRLYLNVLIRVAVQLVVDVTVHYALVYVVIVFLIQAQPLGWLVDELGFGEPLTCSGFYLRVTL